MKLANTTAKIVKVIGKRVNSPGRSSNERQEDWSNSVYTVLKLNSGHINKLEDKKWNQKCKKRPVNSIRLATFAISMIKQLI